MRLEPFRPEHLRRIEVQEAQRRDFMLQPDPTYGEAWTAFDGERGICSAGLLQLWPGRAYAWAVLSLHAGPYLLEITRIARFILAASTYERIEMYVDEDFEQGRRWAGMLGFRCETPEPMRKYLPSGASAYLYARVR